MTLVRWLMMLGGVALVWPALFLYEDQEKALRNKLADWWVALKDRQSQVTSLESTFVRAISKTVLNGYERVFGPKLFSLRSVAVSACLSAASLYLYHGASLVRRSNPHVQTWAQLSTLQAIVYLLFAYGATRVRWIAVVGLVFSLFPAILLDPIGGFWPERLRYQFEFASIIGLGIFCDYLALLAGRMYLNTAQKFGGLLSVIGGLFGGVAIATTLILSPSAVSLYLEKKYGWEWAGTLEIVSVTNIFSVLPVLLWPVTAGVLFLHRLVWPFIERPIYALERFGIFEYRKAIAGFGAALALGGLLGTDIRSLSVSLVEFASGAKTIPTTPDGGPLPTAALPQH